MSELPDFDSLPNGEDGDGDSEYNDLVVAHNAGLHMTRAERRRAAREKEWSGFNPETDQTLPTIAQRINQHNLMCQRCRSGNVVKRGCPGLNKLYQKHAAEIRALLGIAEEPQDEPVHHVIGHEDGTVEVVESDNAVGDSVPGVSEAPQADS